MTISHKDHIPEDRQAIAPYNFVPLYEKVVSVSVEELPTQDQYHEQRKTGRIVCTLTTESPLFVRCGLTPEQFAAWGNKPFADLSPEQKQQYAQFFSTERNKNNVGAPMIPGSSLRGMLRTLVEIVGYGKMTQVTDQQRYMFRAVAAPDDDPLSKPYRRLLKNVRAGYLVRQDDKWFIQPATTINNRTFLKVQERNIPNSLEVKGFDDPEYCPQCRQVSFTYRATRNRQLVVDQIDKRGVYTNKGVLVTSGNMLETNTEGNSGRKNHCVVLERSQDDLIPIDDMAIEDYLLALTDFQKEKPFDPKWGMLKHGRPVFYCQSERNQPIIFFGQSPNFRVPYRPPNHNRAASPLDFVPHNLRSSEKPDLAEAIFGYVSKEKQSEDQKGKARAGRVFVSDAILTPDQALDDIWLSEKPFAPHILSSPKPTTFQHYLVQPKSEKGSLKHYASTPEEETTIRGHKRYWHQRDVTINSVKDPNFNDKPEEEQQSDTQHTWFKPVKAGVTFTFDIQFENLSEVELGALLWVLDKASGEHRLSLGMGKPLGMGAIEITYTVQESDRKQRYSSLFTESQWTSASQVMSQETIAHCTKQFSDHVIRESGETVSERGETTRIACLLDMLRWPGLEQKEVRYMEIERPRTKEPIQAAKCRDDKCNEYANRPVLPMTWQILGEAPPQQPTHTSSTKEQAASELSARQLEGTKEVTRSDTAKEKQTPLSRLPKQVGLVVKLATPGKPGEPGEVQDEDGKSYPYLIADVIANIPLECNQRVMFQIGRRKIPQKNKQRWQPAAVEIQPM